MSANAISYNSTANHWEFDGQRFFTPPATFSRKNRIRSKGLNGLIVNEPEVKTGRRLLDDCGLGALIAFALGNGIDWIQFDRVNISVVYLIEALSFKGAYGWFIDYMVNNDDHAFNPVFPTPGGSFGKGQELNKQAESLEDYARLARVAHRTDEADQTEAQAEDLRQQAREMLYGKR